MRIMALLLLSYISQAQIPIPYPRDIITVQNPHYITHFAQATNVDTNVVLSTTVLTGQYIKIQGTEARHIVIVNQGGSVIMTGGMEIDDCAYLDILGYGTSDYGFKFTNGSSPQPVHIEGKSHHITVKGYMLKTASTGGIWAKTEVDEVQNKYACDLTYLTTPMTNITLSNNWIEDVGGECFYLGSTGWDGSRPMTCGGTTTYPIPQQIGYFHCDSNIIINAGRTGAQMSGSINSPDNFGTFIGNQVYYSGRGLESNQGFGLGIGGSFLNPTVRNNVVHGSYNYNYYITGYGRVVFDGNDGDSSGYWKLTQNPQRIPGAVFSTTVAPTTWIITNNHQGLNTSIPSTGFAIYPSFQNNIDNVICNNTGTPLYILDNPLTYTTNCTLPNMKFSNRVSKVRNLTIELPPTGTTFFHGFNTDWRLTSMTRLKNDPTQWATVKALNSSYYTNFLRYPGGSSSLLYYWYNPTPGDSLGQRTQEILYDFAVAANNPDDIAQYDPDRKIKQDIDDYQKFLNMAQAMQITPSITINNQFYNEGAIVHLLENLTTKEGVVWNAGGLQPNRWTIATQYITNQINYTHSIYTGDVFWEIGNECYARMTANDYAETIIRITAIIKGLYPNDKICAAIEKGGYQNDQPLDDIWNHTLINALKTDGTLYKIDYWIPHSYYGSTDIYTTDAEINARVTSNVLTRQYNYLTQEAGFPIDYSLRLFFTEYNSSRTTANNINTNTQLHAYLELSTLLDWRSKPQISGALSHTWNSSTNGSFLDAVEAASLPYAVSSNQNSYYKYIAPQGIADSLFMATVGRIPISSTMDGSVRVAVSTTGTTTYTQVLNLREIPVSYTVAGTSNYTIIRLNDLTSHSWDVTANKTTGAGTIITLPPRSFCYYQQ